VAYQTDVTGNDFDTATIRAGVIMYGVEYCFDTSEVTIINPPPWWQADGGDVVTGGDAYTDVPVACSNIASCDSDVISDPVNDPGVLQYLGSLFYGDGQVSSTNWASNSLNTEILNFEYFDRRMPTVNPTPISGSVNASTLASGGANYQGYSFFESPGDLTLTNNLSLGAGNKVILIVNGNLTINADLGLLDGRAFLLIVVDGNITIDPSLGGDPGPDLEGIYVADGQISTGETNTQLVVRGAMIDNSVAGINLQRDLDDNSETPAERFIFAPDQMFAFPSFFSGRAIEWKEVAP
jgi:hypothetical protein